MSILYKVLVFLYLMIIVFPGIAQKEGKHHCDDFLDEAYARFEKKLNQVIEFGRFFKIETEVATSKFVKGKMQRSVIKYTLYSDGTRNYVIGEDFAFYKDDSVTVTVSFKNKQIEIHKDSTNDILDTTIRDFLYMKSTEFTKRANYPHCTHHYGGLKEYRYVFFDDNPFADGIDSINLQISAENVPSISTIVFKEDQPIRAIQAKNTFSELEDKPIELKTSPIENIYAENKLLTRYVGFKVIDLR